MNYPQKEVLVTYKSTPNGLTMSWKTGQSFDAKFDGKDYPVKGCAEGTAVSLKKVNDRSIDMINKRDGKIVALTHITVSDDGKTLVPNQVFKPSVVGLYVVEVLGSREGLERSTVTALFVIIKRRI